jgi:DNA-directed RNA polymerase II subunit RPB2
MEETASLSQEGLGFLEKYFRETEFALTRHHIDSYEQAVFDEIPSIIHSHNPIVFMKEPLDKEGTAFAYRVEVFIGGEAATPAGLALSVSPPIVTVDGGATVRRMFPNEARLRNLTYAAQINADILVRVTFTKQKEGAPTGTYETTVKEMPVLRNFPLFKLPILLRSKLCATGAADPARLEEMGECRNDYGGYFIVSGAEKVLICREEQAFNSLYIDRQPDPKVEYTGYASVVSLHPETKQTRRVALYQMPGGEIRVAIPMVRGAFPLFILFRALGVESDEEIVRMIFPTPDPLEEMLTDSIEDAYPIFNRYTAIQYIKSLTKGFSEAHVLDILQNLMLPHVPNEPLARAHYLAEMARELLFVLTGKSPKTDRDDMRTQRFLTTGILVRELFNACWKDWRAAVVETVDRAYRGNPQLYQGEHVFDLFGDANITTVFQPETLNKSIMRGFRGRWGTNEKNEKTGVLQPLARISYLDAMSHTRRVVSDFPSGMKTTGPRKLNTSQIGYFCTSETPQGAHIGLTKNMSMMTQFSFGAQMKPVLGWLREKGGVIAVAETTPALRATAAVVQINGGTIGFTLDPVGIVRVLRLLKWNAFLSPTASISFNSLEKKVRIYLDEGRPVRPLWHIAGEGAAFLAHLPTLKKMSWRDLVFGTSPATAGATLRSVKFLDPLGDQPTATFADYESLLAPTAGFIEYCDPMEMNEAFISWWGGGDLTADHTHAEIHPSTIPGLMASMIPYSNHNQAPRNQLSNSQSKQGIGYMATNIKDRYDTYSSMLCYGEAPLCRTFYYDTIANGEMPYGFNCVIAATSESGYNQDDGLIINRDSVARGMFQSLALRSYDCAEEVDPRTKVHSHVANPASVPLWTALRPGWDYSKLDDRGIIREGEIVDDSTVLVGRYMVIPETHEVKDASITPGLHTTGRVDSVVVLHQGEGRMLVKVRVVELRMPALGDKFSSRHGQKGTIGMLVSSADLPRTAEGLVPDVMVNPGGLISRMTVAQLVEMVAGRAGAEVAAKFNATTFCNGGEFVTQLGDVLQALGASRAGDNVLYSGITGTQIRTDVFMCPLYFMRLKHLTEDKVNARGAGRREIRTHQPTGGRANEGGLRIGEMERDSLCAHGVSAFLQESMMKRGDATEFWVCNGCGRIPIYNEAEGLFVCPSCEGPLNFTGLTADTLTLQMPTKQSRVTFSKVAMPYTLKLIDQEATAIGNFGFRIISESSVARLREDDWEWPEMSVEFKPGERTVEAGGEMTTVEEERVGPRIVGKAVTGGVATAAAAPGSEGAAAVLAAAEGEESSEQMMGAGAVLTFNDRMVDDREAAPLLTGAATPFRISGAQIPGPGGLQYPEFAAGVAERQVWPTVEHYYQAMKFPQDPEWQEQIRQAPTPMRAKRLGTDRTHPVRADWEAIKERVMKAALKAKFQQNPVALAHLQRTRGRRIVYDNKGDAFWGTGRDGAGRNRLGELLIDVRRELKDVRVDRAFVAELGEKAPVDLESMLDANPSDREAFVQDYIQKMRVRVEEGTGDEEMEDQPANLVEAAQGLVAEATGGQVKIVATGAGATEETGQQQGGGQGVYLFVNPLLGTSSPEVSRVARARSSGGRTSVSWAGMEGGGNNSGVGELTSTSDVAPHTEINVMKEE